MKQVDIIPPLKETSNENKVFLDLLYEFMETGYKIALIDKEEQEARFPGIHTVRICEKLNYCAKRQEIRVKTRKRGPDLYLTKEEQDGG